jgi:hypothetical protein
MAFDSSGKLYQKTQTATGVETDTNGIKINTSTLTSLIATTTPTAGMIPMAGSTGILGRGWTSSVDVGDGSDGIVTISSNTSLTRDMYYDTLVVNTGVTLNTNGFRVFVKNSINTVGTGKLASNGGDASGQTAGAIAYSGTTTLPAVLAGKTGGNANTAGTAGTGINIGLTATSSAVGGASGATLCSGSGSGGYAGGASTTYTYLPKAGANNYTSSYNLFDLYNNSLIQYGIAPSSGSGAGGGNGGGGCVGAVGGGSGAPGGVVVVYASQIVNLNIEAKGGNGGNGGNGSYDSGSSYVGAGGGGGGGVGGVIIVGYGSITGTLSTNVSGGARGEAGAGTNQATAYPGTAGNNGKTFIFQM